MKKVLTIIVALFLCISTSVGVSAAHQSTNNQKISKKIEKLAAKYNVQIELSEGDANDLMISDLAELEDLFRGISDSSNHIPIDESQEIVMDVRNNQTLIKDLAVQLHCHAIYRESSAAEATWVFTQWAPIQYVSYLGPLGSLFAWREVVFNYYYIYPSGGTASFTGYRNVVSDLYGAAIQDWVQTGCSVNFSTQVNYHDTATVSVTGYAYVGIQFEGINFSVRTSTQTWTYSLRLVS